jgi:NADPH-dependent 2,4-dienoyl-CoA reductase/sulfur reductase-like enzyme
MADPACAGERGRVVVVGASLGGLRAAEQLRAAGWTGQIIVVGAEPHMPYSRPPLSKEALAAGTVALPSLALLPRAGGADIAWRLGTAVSSADFANRVLTLADGQLLGFDGLVVATGLRPRRLRCPGPGEARHVLRTLDDAARLRIALTRRAGVRLVVIGAGFVGCEVAATARRLGADVTVLDPLPLPLVGPLGAPLATALLRLHRAHGVRFVLDRGVDHFDTGRVILNDGTVLPADVVVEAVGSLPNTDWLEGNGFDLSDGVLCDAHLRVEGLPYAVAVGDVARFPNARYDDVPRRVEHWSIAGHTARRAARTLVAGLTGTRLDESRYAPLPTFWSDQYDHRLQAVGTPTWGMEDIRVLDGNLDRDVVVGYHREGELVGVVGFGGRRSAAGLARYGANLAQHRHARVDDAQATVDVENRSGDVGRGRR